MPFEKVAAYLAGKAQCVVFINNEDGASRAGQPFGDQPAVIAIHDPGFLRDGVTLQAVKRRLESRHPIGIGLVVQLVQIDRGQVLFLADGLAQRELACIGRTHDDDARPQAFQRHNVSH
ncbi:MAG: hypothetical protein ACI9GK_003437 [Devosia sp.]|jgi:hypothetical protein